MARIRTIKPDFWTDDKLTECSVSARLLFIGTWNFADDDGNLDRSAKQIKARVFPVDNIDCEPLLVELIAQGLLTEYSVNGKNYLHIRGFRKHQIINRPSAPTCPRYDESLITHATLTESSLNTHDGREGKERKGINTSSPDKPDDGFAVFWKAYPRKVGKGAALKAWSKIKSKAETLQMILKALEWQRSCEQWVKNGGQFIPHPGTWINEQRWLDEQSNKPVAEPQRPVITLETRRAAMQAQADEGYKIRKWLDGERRYRTVFKIEGESIKATKEYESEAMA